MKPSTPPHRPAALPASPSRSGGAILERAAAPRARVAVRLVAVVALGVAAFVGGCSGAGDADESPAPPRASTEPVAQDATPPPSSPPACPDAYETVFAARFLDEGAGADGGSDGAPVDGIDAGGKSPLEITFDTPGKADVIYSGAITLHDATDAEVLVRDVEGASGRIVLAVDPPSGKTTRAAFTLPYTCSTGSGQHSIAIRIEGTTVSASLGMSL